MELKTRSAAQIRSHAQKFIIKLCKKYQIKIKSKKFKKKFSKHLNYFNKQRGFKEGRSAVIDSLEKKLLDTFNYYNREYKPFLIDKRHRENDLEGCGRLLKNKRTAFLIQNQIFYIKKMPKISEKNDVPLQDDFHLHQDQNFVKNNLNYLTTTQGGDIKNTENLTYPSQNFLLYTLQTFCEFNDSFITNLSSNNFDFFSNGSQLSKFLDNFLAQNLGSLGHNKKIYNSFYEEIQINSQFYIYDLCKRLTMNQTSFPISSTPTIDVSSKIPFNDKIVFYNFTNNYNSTGELCETEIDTPTGKMLFS
jgi:hypothetical protein